MIVLETEQIIAEKHGGQLANALARQERNREEYRTRYDHFIKERLSWRASISRHLLHLCPGHKILEIGAGKGDFTKALLKATRGECQITAATFSGDNADILQARFQDEKVEIASLVQFPAHLTKGTYDFIIAHRLLENTTRNQFLKECRGLLKPGGGLLLFDLNPWNSYYRLRRIIQKIIPLKWKRPADPVSLNRYQIYSLLSEMGFVSINALPYDFLYSPIPRCLLWPAKHLSLLMENCPFVRNFAGTLKILAYKPNDPEGLPVLPDLARHQELYHKVSFVIPCHNEEMNVMPIISRLKECFDRYIHEIIIVDDNSSDNTALIAEEMASHDARIRVIRRLPPNGVGRALREGLAAARGDFIMTMDSDFQNIIPEMRDLFDEIAKGADVAIGSRFSRDSVVLNYPFTKIIANRMFHLFVNLFLLKDRHCRDISNNLKIFKRDVVRHLTIEMDDFAANAETGLKPLLQGYAVKEVPISWMNRSVTMGLSSFKIFRTGPNYAKLLGRLLSRRWFGKGKGKG